MIELDIVYSAQQLGKGVVDYFTIFISNIPFMLIFLLFLLILIFVYEKKKLKIVLLTVLLALVFHFVITECLIKNAYYRERPYLAFPELIHPLGQPFKDSSFPSSHLASTAAVLTVLIYFHRKYWLPAALAVLLMAFSRVHNGMHYPSDVLTGIILGSLYGLAAVYSINWLAKKKRPIKPITTAPG